MCLRACEGWRKMLAWGEGGPNRLLGVTMHYLVWLWRRTEGQKSVQRTPEVAGSPSIPLDLLSVPWPCPRGISPATITLVAAVV